MFVTFVCAYLCASPLKEFASDRLVSPFVDEGRILFRPSSLGVHLLATLALFLGVALFFVVKSVACVVAGLAGAAVSTATLTWLLVNPLSSTLNGDLAVLFGAWDLSVATALLGVLLHSHKRSISGARPA